MQVINPATEEVLADVELRVCIKRSIIVENIDHFEPMFLSKLIVVHIMRRRDLQRTCTEVHTYIFIHDNGNAAIYQWDINMLSMQMPVPLILRMDTNSSISHDRFRSYGSDRHEWPVFTTVLLITRVNKIFQVVKLLCRFFSDDFFITKCRLCFHVPIDHPFAAVDVSFFI